MWYVACSRVSGRRVRRLHNRFGSGYEYSDESGGCLELARLLNIVTGCRKGRRGGDGWIDQVQRVGKGRCSPIRGGEVGDVG